MLVISPGRLQADPGKQKDLCPKPSDRCLGVSRHQYSIINLIRKSMKKISLKDINLNGIEQLSRDELKKVLGGFDGGYGGYGDGGYGGVASCSAECYCPTGYRVKGSNETMYEVSGSCEGGCVARDGVGVECTDIEGYVYCDDGANCEKIPSYT